MTAASKAFDNVRKDGILGSQPILASTKIFKGIPTFLKAVARTAFTNDGVTNTLANGDVFAGISADLADASAGLAEPATYVQVWRRGDFKLPFSDTLTQADVGKKVYVNNVSDDNVVTITSDAGNPEVCIGVITQIESASVAYVNIDDYVGSAADSTGGSGSDLFEVVTVTVLATATTGTATVTAGSTPISAVPTSNQDQFIDNIAVSSTTVTVTLAAAATANNVFRVTLLKA